jgi:outer membrane protein TolC
MLKNNIFLLLVLVASIRSNAQTLSLAQVIDSITASHPVIKMYNSEIRSMDEAAKGARSWMPPQIGVGQFMTPYDVSTWKKSGDEPGMGFVMVSGEQMFPNKKQLDANEAYMQAMSSVEAEKKNATLNDLVSEAKGLYYDWIMLKKKQVVVAENEKILEFMTKNAEIRYKNGVEKISAYYKAKAALGNLKNMQLMFESDAREKRIRLNALMGRSSNIPLEIDSVYTLKDFSSLVFDTTLFYNSRSDLKAIDKDIMLASLKQETEKQSLRPQFGVRYDNMINFAGQPMQYTLMGMIKFPMAKWSSKMNKANIESLKWKASSLQSQKEMMVNEYSGMSYGMRNEFELKKNQLSLYEKEIIPALKNNYRTMQIGYEQNTEELFMLYDAWETLNMKQLEWLEILRQALVLQVNIERLIEQY